MYQYGECHMELQSLPLSSVALNRLHDAGFRIVSELSSYKPISLSQELKVSLKEATSIFNVLKKAISTPNSAGVGKYGIGKAQASTSSSSSSSTAEATASGQNSETRNEDGAEVSKFPSLSSTSSRNSEIITFVRQLDQLLRGGISCGQITELCGAPGTGKTQMAMQLAVNVTIPRIHAGQGGECLYIDTEGAMSTIRLNEMAAALNKHLCRISKTHRLKPAQRKGLSEEAQVKETKKGIKEKLEAAEALTADAILDKIQVFDKIKDYGELIAVLEKLPGMIESIYTRTKLIIIDSIAMPLRVAMSRKNIGNHEKGRMIARLAKALITLSKFRSPAGHGLHIVTTNHVVVSRQGGVSALAGFPMHRTTHNSTVGVGIAGHGHSHTGGECATATSDRENARENTYTYASYYDSPQFKLAPALGDTWSSAIHKRLMLFWSQPGVRHAALARDFLPRFRHPSHYPAVPFHISENGVRDEPQHRAPAVRESLSLAGGDIGSELEMHVGETAHAILSSAVVAALPFDYSHSQDTNRLSEGGSDRVVNEEKATEAVALGEQGSPGIGIVPPVPQVPARDVAQVVPISRDPKTIYDSNVWNASPDVQHAQAGANSVPIMPQSSPAKRTTQEVYGNWVPPVESETIRRRI